MIARTLDVHLQRSGPAGAGKGGPLPTCTHTAAIRHDMYMHTQQGDAEVVQRLL